MCKKSNLPDFRFWFIQFVNLDLYSFNHSFNMFWEKLIQQNIHFFLSEGLIQKLFIQKRFLLIHSKNIHFFENWRIGQGYGGLKNYIILIWSLWIWSWLDPFQSNYWREKKCFRNSWLTSYLNRKTIFSLWS